MKRKPSLVIPSLIFFLACCLMMAIASNRSVYSVLIGFLVAIVAYGGLLVVIPASYECLLQMFDAAFGQDREDEE